MNHSKHNEVEHQLWEKMDHSKMGHSDQGSNIPMVDARKGIDERKLYGILFKNYDLKRNGYG